MKQNIKEILYVIAFILFIGIGTYWIFSATRDTPPPVEVTPIGNSKPINLPPPLPTSSLPVESTIVIGTPTGGVEVKNFYKFSVERDATRVLIGLSPDYRLTYFLKDASFLIGIQSVPFNIAREKAEQAFLEKLGISKEVACRLNVTVGVPYHVDPNLAGENFSLSFCKPKVQ